MKTTTDIGRFGENAACAYLKSQKYKIIEQNYFASHNEIDIIAENKQYIVFVEVKTRTVNHSSEFGTPASAVTYSKQKRTLAAAQAYLNVHKTNKFPRLDVIEVYLSKALNKNEPKIVKINHIEDAFSN
jgi:putative endonuclease